MRQTRCGPDRARSDALFQHVCVSPHPAARARNEVVWAASAGGQRGRQNPRLEMKNKSKSETTRERILETATGLFQRRGFETATMREIAAEAGMATGAAYYYFDSKDAIVLA